MIKKAYVTRDEMIEAVKSIKGSTFITFVAETEVGLTGGKGNPYQGATKVSHISGQLGKNYTIAVNNQLGREDKEMDFEAQAPKGKIHTDCKHLLKDEKTGTKTYLVIYPQKQSEETRAEHPTKYYFNNQEIDVELLRPTFKPSYSPKSQGTDTAVIYRTYNIDNILSMHIKALDIDMIVIERMTEQEKELVGIDNVAVPF